MNELGNIKVYFILYIRFFKIEYDIDNIPKKIYKDIHLIHTTIKRIDKEQGITFEQKNIRLEIFNID